MQYQAFPEKNPVQIKFQVIRCKKTRCFLNINVNKGNNGRNTLEGYWYFLMESIYIVYECVRSFVLSFTASHVRIIGPMALIFCIFPMILSVHNSSQLLLLIH